MDREDFRRAAEIIGKHDTVIIHRHTHPDGDAIGSQTGLKHILKKAFPEKRILAVGDDPGRYGFITDSTPESVSDSEYENALAIVLDTSSPELISDKRYERAKETMRFDHHLFSSKICDHEFTDSSYESCCGLIADFARNNGFEPDGVAAEALYTGLVTDSGRFLYDSVSSRTHEIASWLLRYRFDRSRIYSSLYSEDFSSVLRKAEFVKRIRFTDNKVAWVYNTVKDAESFGMTPYALSRSMVNVMANIRGVHIWVNFTECDEGVLAELRSDLININPVAVRHGGGGHMKASGATLHSEKEVYEMLSELDALAREIK